MTFSVLLGHFYLCLIPVTGNKNGLLTHYTVMRKVRITVRSLPQALFLFLGSLDYKSKNSM